MDLFSKIFTWKEERLSVTQIREHPWIRSNQLANLEYYKEEIRASKFDEIFNKANNFENLIE